MARKKILIDQYHIDITTTRDLTDTERAKIDEVFEITIKRFAPLLLMQFPTALQKKIKLEITR